MGGHGSGNREDPPPSERKKPKTTLRCGETTESVPIRTISL